MNLGKIISILQMIIFGFSIVASTPSGYAEGSDYKECSEGYDVTQTQSCTYSVGVHSYTWSKTVHCQSATTNEIGDQPGNFHAADSSFPHGGHCGYCHFDVPWYCSEAETELPCGGMSPVSNNPSE